MKKQILKNVAPADFHEVFEAAKKHLYNWNMSDFIDNQTEIISKCNALLAAETGTGLLPDTTGQGETVVTCYIHVRRKRLQQELEMEQAVKYAGVIPHVATQVEVGAILYSSWGYEQTNVDFYVVVEMSKSMCKLLPVNAYQVDIHGHMSGTVKAGKHIDFTGELLHKKIQDSGRGQYVRIESFAHASLWDGKKKYESSYH